MSLLLRKIEGGHRLRFECVYRVQLELGASLSGILVALDVSWLVAVRAFEDVN